MAGETFTPIEFSNNSSPYISDTNLNLMQSRIDNAIKTQKNRITDLKQNKQQGVNTAGWYRIGIIYGTGHPSYTAILTISTDYNQSLPSGVVVAITTTWHSARISQLNSIVANENNKSLIRIKVIYSSNDNCFYIDAYYNFPTTNGLHVYNENILSETATARLELIEPIAETYVSTVVDEILIKYNETRPTYWDLGNYLINGWTTNGPAAWCEVDAQGFKHIQISCRNGTNANMIQLPNDLKPENGGVLIPAINFTQDKAGYVAIGANGIVEISSALFTSGSSSIVFGGIYK